MHFVLPGFRLVTSYLLDRIMKNAFEYEAELAALREELSDTRESHESMRADLIATERRLKAAEQRNARLESLLHRSYGAVRACNYDDLESDIDEVLNPTESGASE